MRALLLVPIAAVLVTTARASHAKPTVGECLSATETSLKLRADRKVREARAQALVCAAPSCPAEVREECAARVADLNAAVPTVVFSAKGADGQELSLVKVSMDGEALADHLDGSAIAVDPGTHQFTFDVAGQATVTSTLIIHEGEKNRHEVVLMAPPVPVATPATGAAASSSQWHGQRLAGVVTGGVGVVALAVGGVFGGLTFSAWSTAKDACPSHAACSTKAIDDRTTATTYGTVSTVGFIAGGVLAAGGLTLYLTAPKREGPRVGLQMGPRTLGVAGRF